MIVWFLLILAVQCLLLVLLGWLVQHARQSSGREDSRPPSQWGEPPQECANVQSLLAAAGRALAEHASELDGFEKSLGGRAEASGGEDPSQFRDRVEHIRQANRHVTETVDETLAGLIAACGDLLSAEQSHLEAYQEKTESFDGTLASLNTEMLLADIARKLLDIVRELRDDNKSILHELTAAHEKTIELMARAHAAEQTSRIDPLTQLPNRRTFEEAHAQCDESLKRTGRPYSLVLVDIDHFKSVNDEFGHAAGDAVLSLVGRIFRDNRRTSDYVCRLGGEEFAMLLPDCKKESARLVSERHRRKIELAKLRYDGNEISVTVSCGVAQALLGESRSQLLQRADSALYAAKMHGRNQTKVDHCDEPEDNERDKQNDEQDYSAEDDHADRGPLAEQPVFHSSGRTCLG